LTALFKDAGLRSVPFEVMWVRRAAELAAWLFGNLKCLTMLLGEP
jgi:hypothetical protein